MTLVECRNVTVAYGSFAACSGVNFAIHEGEYVCIVGANGSGKSTLVKAILGLLPVKEGTITRDALHTGYLPQQNKIKRDFPATVRETVLSGCAGNSRFFYGRADRRNAEIQMERLEITALADRPFRELSGGQQQRVLLARALCAAKNLLVLDEPVTGLDPVVTDGLYAVIRRLNQEDGLAVLMVSHDVRRAVQNATHILHMDNSPLFFGTTDCYKKTPLYETLGRVEVCGTHLCAHCGPDCRASHIPAGRKNDG